MSEYQQSQPSTWRFTDSQVFLSNWLHLPDCFSNLTLFFEKKEWVWSPQRLGSEDVTRDQQKIALNKCGRPHTTFHHFLLRNVCAMQIRTAIEFTFFIERYFLFILLPQSTDRPTEYLDKATESMKFPINGTNCSSLRHH